MQTPQRLAVDAPDLGWKDLVASSYVVLIGWLGRIAWSRIDGKASRAEVAALLLDMQDRDRKSEASRDRIHEKLDLVIANANKIAVDVARLEGAKHALLPPPSRD